MSESTPSIAPDPPDPAASLRATDVLHVAVGVIRNERDQILIARRQPGVHLEGFWEFPGGKVEQGESVVAALKRELHEELDIEVGSASPLIKVKHQYPERRVLLDVWQVDSFSGRPQGRQGQSVRWVQKQDLPHVVFPKGNRAIASAARLPHRYAILDCESGDPKVLADSLARLAKKGIRMIQLRAKGLEKDSRCRSFAERALEYCRARGIILLLNSDPNLATALGADGVHLNAARLMALKERPLDSGYWVAASCHNQLELRQAERMHVDFVLLSPVARTLTHPERAGMGWAAFTDLVDRVNVPVYALGGLTEYDLQQARESGAQGIAAIRGFL